MKILLEKETDSFPYRRGDGYTYGSGRGYGNGFKSGEGYGNGFGYGIEGSWDGSGDGEEFINEDFT